MQASSTLAAASNWLVAQRTEQPPPKRYRAGSSPAGPARGVSRCALPVEKERSVTSDGCFCIKYQQDGVGPWVIIGPNPSCPVHGDDDD